MLSASSIFTKLFHISEHANIGSLKWQTICGNPEKQIKRKLIALCIHGGNQSTGRLWHRSQRNQLQDSELWGTPAKTINRLNWSLLWWIGERASLREARHILLMITLLAHRICFHKYYLLWRIYSVARSQFTDPITQNDARLHTTSIGNSSPWGN